MATITSVTRWTRQRRADVALDDGSAFSLSLDVIADRGVAEGGSLTAAERQALEDEDQRRGAIQSALRLVAAHPRSEQDLRQRLRRRKWSPTAANAAVARMRELGYLDDSAFARFFVEGRQASTPRSRRFLQYELARHGVDKETVVEATDGVSDEEAAYDAAQRRLRVLQGLDYQTFQRRLGTFLSSRGFGYGVARQVIDRCWQEVAEA